MQIDDAIQEVIDELHAYLQQPDLDIETKKIYQKLREAKYDKGNVMPLADCMLAILLAAKSEGFSVKTVFEAPQKVAKDIRGKKWKKMPDGTYRAIRPSQPFSRPGIV